MKLSTTRLSAYALARIGVTGRQCNAAYARSNTWNVPASVTQQLLIQSNDGLDDMPEIDADDSFNQDYIGMGEVGDHKPIVTDLNMTLRFEQGADVFMAAAMGSAAAPVVTGSTAANSQVSNQHVLTMAPELTHFYTIATDMGQYVQEVRTAKIAGFVIKVGNNGRMQAAFSLVGDRTTYDSVTNTNSTVAAAANADSGFRAYRRLCRLRMNAQGAAALGAGDAIGIAREFTLTAKRPLAQDPVLNSDSIIEADDDGFFEGTLEVTYARMLAQSANSLVTALQNGASFKADLLMNGTFINSLVRRSYLFEMPALQPETYKGVVSGHGVIRPVVTYKLRLADSLPAGMTTLNPMQITVTNARTTNLLT